LVDDISTSGGTIINAATLCLEKGAKSVHAVVVHPDFAPGVAGNIQNSVLASFWTTNTIEKTVDDLSKYDKIKVVDIAQIFEI
jgi:ribose-phosphate pyrophosphokinase